MARYNDGSPHPDRWTNAKLMREARRLANLETIACSLDMTMVKPWSGATVDPKHNEAGDAIREATRIYRNSWLNPVLDEIESRFVKTAKASARQTTDREDGK